MPHLSVERVSRRRTGSAAEPLALVERVGSSQRVAACCPRASADGVQSGQSLADARAILPTLAVQPHDPQADRAELERLATGATQFAPIVQPVEPATLLLDVTGCERLFGSEERQLRQATAWVEAAGVTVRGAVAGTVGAAWAMAHAGDARTAIIESGQELATLASLPMRALRLDGALVETLAQLGIEMIGDVMAMPRSALASRFGQAVLDRLDQAQGTLDESIEPFRPTPPPAVRMRLGFPTDRQDVLIEASRHLMARVIERLESMGQGLSRLLCTFHREQAQPLTANLWLSRPTRQLMHLMTLLAERIESVDMSIPVSAISMHVTAMAAIPQWQGRLFDAAETDREESMSQLLDAMANRLGPDAVVQPVQGDDHQPEYACQYEPVTETPQQDTQLASKASRMGGNMLLQAEAWRPDADDNDATDVNAAHDAVADRPVRLLSPPQSVEVIAAPVEGRLAWFRWHNQCHAVSWATGPERIETGWWRGQHVCRDYYVVQDEPGRRFWLFRDRGSRLWFVHGCFQ